MVGSGRVDRTVNYIKAQGWIILIETHLKILRRVVIGEKHCPPFNVKDPVRRAARDRSEDAAGSTREIRASAQTDIGAHVLPQWEDGIVICTLIG
jgi:hypothetical protein